jgi:hypothetical protein
MTVELRNPACVDVDVIVEGDWVTLEADTTHEVDI